MLGYLLIIISDSIATIIVLKFVRIPVLSLQKIPKKKNLSTMMMSKKRSSSVGSLTEEISKKEYSIVVVCHCTFIRCNISLLKFLEYNFAHISIKDNINSRDILLP